MISVERNFNMSKIEAYIARRVEERIQEVIAFLRAKGLEYTELARSKTLVSQDNRYNNITYNLISSVGFTLARDDKVIESYFPILETGAEGAAKGKEVGEREAIAISTKNSIVLMLVAGENYAEFVQDKGKDVTYASSLAFEKFLNQIWGAYK